jgi:Tol biopolymer transport system component
MKNLFLSIILLSLISCTKSINEKNNHELRGDYLGFSSVNDTAQIFAEGIISTQFNERDMTISPDGNELFFSLKGPSFYSLIHMKQINGMWNEKEVAPFSGKYSDLEPCFSPDGKKLFFVSNRPMADEKEPKDYDIWFVEKTDTGWGSPINPGAPLNSEANEFYPSITKDGTLYFCARTETAIGGEDLFFSKLVNGKYQTPVNLGDSVNTERDEFNAFVSVNEDFIIYTSTGWGAGLGGGDLWISFKNKDNVWKKPQNMGDKINTPFLEYCPSISPDGKYLFFTSNRSSSQTFSENKLRFNDLIEGLQSTINGSQNIYWINTDIIEKLKTN